jgi:RNA polymerase sigma factor for flagellar operon FliA
VSVAGSKTAVPETLRAKIREAYARGSRDALEETWILKNIPLVHHIVQKVASHLSRKIDVEDLIAAGTLGLVKAARAFDPAKDVEFRTYAYIRIRGAIIDELRGQSFVPSDVSKQIRYAREAYQRYFALHGEAPDDEQLAGELGISPAHLYRTLEEARKQNFLSIHGLTEEHSVLGTFIPLARGPAPDEQAERREMLERLSEAIAQLPKRDRIILLLYYERDLTMKEIAEVLGVSESRVSQLHASALFKLTMRLRISK